MRKRNQLERLPPRDVTFGVTPPVFSTTTPFRRPSPDFSKGRPTETPSSRQLDRQYRKGAARGKAAFVAWSFPGLGRVRGMHACTHRAGIYASGALGVRHQIGSWTLAAHDPDILAPSTPQEFVSSILSLLEAGELIAPSVIRRNSIH